MDLNKLRTFLGWCCVLNFGLLFVMSLFLLFGIESIYNIQANFLYVERESYNEMWFLTIGVWKIMVLVFNLIPYIALRIMAKK